MNNYLVHDGGRGKVFASLQEASAYAAHYLMTTGELIAVTATKRKVTHTFSKEVKN